jgi:RNA polymerase sigma factor (TIGR02999 family)
VAGHRDFTKLLADWQNGDKKALDEITPLLYEELRGLARYFLSAERAGHTLQPTALVHEAYMRLVGQHAVDWRNRAHFLGVAATMMRRILINYAEARNAAKREAHAQAVSLDEALRITADDSLDVLDLNRALERLSELDPQQGRIVELRCFGGLTVEETAEVLEISPATVKREWSTARLWLMHQIGGAPPA